MTESVKVLVKKGADINMVSGAMDYPYVNDSVLIIAAQNNYMEIVKFLLAKGAKHDVKCMSRYFFLDPKMFCLVKLRFSKKSLTACFLHLLSNINFKRDIF